MKKIFVLVATLLSSVSFGQTLAEGIRETINERHDVSEKIFQKLIESNPTNPELYYYQAENFLIGDDKDEAKASFEKASNLDPESNYAKLAKAKLNYIQGDTTAAGVTIREVLKSTKRKNPEILRQVAKIYSTLDVKNADVAIALLEEAVRLEPKNQENYLLLGDAQIINPRNASIAMKSYNQAESINNDARVLVRRAQVYQRAKNASEANKMYQAAIDLEPNYAPTYRAQAELYMEYNNYEKAIKLWEKYITLNDSDKARYRYASSLFAAEQYEKALAEIEKLKTNGFVNGYTLRIEGGSIAKLALAGQQVDVAKGKESIERIAVEYPKVSSSSDYEILGEYAKIAGDTAAYEALINKAIETEVMQAGKQYYYGLLADYYLNTTKEYAKAATFFEKKQNGKLENLSLAEYQEMGRAYFASEQFEKAKEAFDVLIASNDTYVGGYFWKARTLSRLDANNEGLAVQDYEKVLSLLSEEDIQGGYRAIAVEAAAYMGSFNHIKQNVEKATEYFTLVQTLDPTNEKAVAYFKLLKK